MQQKNYNYIILNYNFSKRALPYMYRNNIAMSDV